MSVICSRLGDCAETGAACYQAGDEEAPNVLRVRYTATEYGTWVGPHRAKFIGSRRQPTAT